MDRWTYGCHYTWRWRHGRFVCVGARQGRRRAPALRYPPRVPLKLWLLLVRRFRTQKAGVQCRP